jgi:hypothetical protein
MFGKEFEQKLLVHVADLFRFDLIVTILNGNQSRR